MDDYKSLDKIKKKGFFGWISGKKAVNPAGGQITVNTSGLKTVSQEIAECFKEQPLENKKTAVLKPIDCWNYYRDISIVYVILNKIINATDDIQVINGADDFRSQLLGNKLVSGGSLVLDFSLNMFLLDYLLTGEAYILHFGTGWYNLTSVYIEPEVSSNTNSNKYTISGIKGVFTQDIYDKSLFINTSNKNIYYYVLKNEWCNISFLDKRSDSSIFDKSKNEGRGFTPLNPLREELETYRAGVILNKNKLVKGYNFEGLLLTSVLNDDSLSEIKDTLKNSAKGYENSDKLIIVNNDGSSGAPPQLIDLSIKHRDMLFNELMKDIYEKVSSAYNVPIALVNNIVQTYNNLGTSQIFLYENAVLPLLKKVLPFISKVFQIDLKYDQSKIDAIKQKKVAEAKEIASIGALTPNELRVLCGYDKIDKISSNYMDRVYINNQMLPIDKIESSLHNDINNSKGEVND